MIKKEYLTLTIANPVIRIYMPLEEPSLYISIYPDFIHKEEIKPEWTATVLESHYINQKKVSITHHEFSLNSIKNAGIGLAPLVKKPEVEYVEFELTDCTYPEFSITFNVNYGFDHIFLPDPENEFKKHLDLTANFRILFSSPYGSGKSTFLNHFFKDNANYYPFYVYPVNYAVASNEDIFRYLKADILFQLLGLIDPDDLGDVELTTWQAFEELVYLEPKKTIKLLLQQISKLGKPTEFIYKALDGFDALNKRIEEHRDKRKSNTLTIKSYLEEIYEQEGSLLEDNYITQLIRTLFEAVKKRYTYQFVWVIEDLDRIDPEHIFRILNVVSAHYDSYRHAGDLQTHNKFGFDKIIVVADLHNIRHIFAHKYGPRTDFDGYISKFYSVAPYFFDAFAFADKYLSDKLTIAPNKQGPGYQEREQFTRQIIVNLLQHQVLTIRDVLKFDTGLLHDLLQKDNYQNPFYGSIMAPVIIFLYKTFGKEILKAKLETCQNATHFIETDFLLTNVYFYLLSGLFKDQNSPYRHNLAGQMEEFELKDPKGGYYKLAYNQHVYARQNIITPAMVWELLIKNLEIYDDLCTREKRNSR